MAQSKAKNPLTTPYQSAGERDFRALGFMALKCAWNVANGRKLSDWTAWRGPCVAGRAKAAGRKQGT